MNLVANMNSASKARRNINLFEALNDNAKASKLKARSPEFYGQMVDELTKNGDIRQVGIPSDYFREYFEARGIDPVQAATELGVADQYEETLLGGGDLSIPTGAFAEKLAGTEHFEGLKKDLRFGDDMTVRESEEFRKNMLNDYRREMEDANKTEEERQALKETRDAIRQDFKSQIMAMEHEAYGEQEADNDSELYTAVIMNEARAANMDPMEYHKSFGPRLVYDKTTGSVQAQTRTPLTFAQTMDKDVDLDFRVPVMEVQRATRNTITDQDRKDIAARFGETPVINKDTGLQFSLSRGRHGAGHIAHSAFTQKEESKEALIAAFFHLPELAQEARRARTTSDRKRP
jgi:hypothetical protein